VVPDASSTPVPKVTVDRPPDEPPEEPAVTALETAEDTAATAVVAVASLVTVASQERAEAAASLPEKPIIFVTLLPTSAVNAFAAVIFAEIASLSVPCALKDN
jgi:hypothetical protein